MLRRASLCISDSNPDLHGGQAGTSFERCMDGSGIRSAVGAVVGLSGRWEAGNLLQRACGALGLRDWTVAWLGFYTDPVSPAALFRFFTGNLPGWRRPMVRD